MRDAKGAVRRRAPWQGLSALVRRFGADQSGVTIIIFAIGFSGPTIEG